MSKRKSKLILPGPMVIVFLAAVFFHQALIACPTNKKEDKKEREDTLRQIKHLFFLAENNLYDGRLLLEIKDKIGLSKEQEEKIANLALEQETFSIRRSAEIKIKELQLASYVRSKKRKINREEMERHIREISNEKTGMIIHYMNYLLDLRELLTPGQLETLRQLRLNKLRDIKERKKENRGENRENRETCPVTF